MGDFIVKILDIEKVTHDVNRYRVEKPSGYDFIPGQATEVSINIPELKELKPGDELIVREVWGAINYKGPGVFIAGGAGVTPFIAILRDLKSKDKLNGNKLIFSNKTENDIILKNEFSEMLGDKFINILTREKNDKYYNGRIDETFLKKSVTDYSQNFYICGPDSFVKDINTLLEKLGAKTDSIVFEK